MQAVTQTPTTHNEAHAGRVTLSMELVAYLALAVIALVLRIAELDRVPLTDAEARQALAAWRVVNSHAPGSSIPPESPLLFVLHSTAFTTFGDSEFSARIATALAGVGLVLSPLLFRSLFGRARTFMFSGLLMFSPVLLAASRFDSPAIWAILSAVLGLWAFWRYLETRQQRFALLSSSFAAALFFLTDPAGGALGLVLGVAGLLILGWARLEVPEEDPVQTIRTRLLEWPVRASLLAAAGTVFLTSTAFMLYLPGLAHVGELLLAGMRGLTVPQALPFFPLLTALFYEPVIVVFGLAAVGAALRSGAVPVVDRFFITWLLVALAAALIYRGAGPQHALWLLIPLAGLVSSIVGSLLERESSPFLDVPWWSKLVLVLGTVGLLAILKINVQILSRAILQAPNGSLATVLQALPNAITAVFEAWRQGQQARVAGDAGNIVWVALSLLLLLVMNLFAATLWGGRSAWRGFAFGLLAFALVTSLGAGWGIAVADADRPVELWHTEAVGRETGVLRNTLIELSRRESGGFPKMPLTVLAGDDGIVAWLVRDFENTRFIADVSEARAQKIVLLPALAELPNLGGAYVGQDFIVKRGWSLESLQGFDFLPWWLHRRTRVPGLPSETVVLWLRQDVYDGVPFVPGAS